MTEAVQCYDGDGQKPPTRWQVDDGIVLQSGVVEVSKIILNRPSFVHPDDYLTLEVSEHDHRKLKAVCEATGDLRLSNIYLTRKGRTPLILQNVTSCYVYADYRGNRTYIVKCKSIAQWRTCPGWNGHEVPENLWFTKDDLRKGG